MRTAAPAPGGLVSRGYENVREAFESDLVERADDGAALAAVVDGRLVVDLWGGWADDARSVPWGRGTVAVIFSGSKGLVATLLLIAVDRGLLELDAPVARYWPEFAAHGKGGITVAELASHRAGLPGLSSAVSAKDLDDPGGLAARLAGQAPILQPGHPCYHALTYGWLCGELLRRVDGRDAGRLVQEELAAPLGDLDLAVGLSSGHPLWRRLALLRRSPGYRLSAYLGDDPDPRLDMVYGNPPLAADAWNHQALLRPAVPAVNAVAGAHAMATLYGRLVDGGGSPVSPATVQLGASVAAEGDDPLSARPLRFGPTGFELAGTPSSLGPAEDAFGHTGSGGSSHGAWPSLRTGFSYVTADLRREDADGRAAALLSALHDAVSAR